MATINVTVSDLRLAVNKLLDAVQESMGDEVDLQVDHYWNVPIHQAFDPYRQPTLDKEQVADDVGAASALVATPAEEPLVVWHASDHLAGVFRALAVHDLNDVPS